MTPKSQTILIVEDDAVLMEIVKKGLENASHSVLMASTGQEMFDVLGKTPVNLILLDLGLPDGDALPHIIKIREQTNAPLVILTARERIDDRLMALGLGADDYLTKPIDIRELVLRVNNILTRQAGGANGDARTSIAAQPQPAPQGARRGADQSAHRRASDNAPRRRASDDVPRRRSSDKPKRSAMFVAASILIGITIAGAGAFWLSVSSPEQVAQVTVESAALAAGEQQPADLASDQDPGVEAGTSQAETANASEQPSTQSSSTPSADADAVDDTTQSRRTALAVAETVVVSEQPVSDGSGTSVVVTATPTIPTETATSVNLDDISKAEVLGYAWAFDSKCGAVPQVNWWKYKTRADIAEYVIRRHNSDWEPFIDDLVRRLAKMYDIAERESAAVTPDGDRLEGEDLERYIEQSVARLQVVRCLSEEAKLAASN